MNLLHLAPCGCFSLGRLFLGFPYLTWARSPDAGDQVLVEQRQSGARSRRYANTCVLVWRPTRRLLKVVFGFGVRSPHHHRLWVELQSRPRHSFAFGSGLLDRAVICRLELADASTPRNAPLRSSRQPGLPRFTMGPPRVQGPKDHAVRLASTKPPAPIWRGVIYGGTSPPIDPNTASPSSPLHPLKYSTT